MSTCETHPNGVFSSRKRRRRRDAEWHHQPDDVLGQQTEEGLRIRVKGADSFRHQEKKTRAGEEKK